MQTLLLYALLTTTAFYLAHRAVITRFLWSRYPAWLDSYLGCPSCSGFLYGLLAALVIGIPYDLDFLGITGRTWITPVLVGLGAVVWTPILANLQITALLQLGVADPKATENLDAEEA